MSKSNPLDPSATAKPVKVVLFTDPGKDLDDEHTLVLAAGLHRQRLIELVAVVANLNPAMERARLAKGTLSQLGLWDIPVGIGESFDGGTTSKHEMGVPYLAPHDTLAHGQTLVLNTLRRAEDASLTFVCISGLTDAAKVFMNHPDLCIGKVRDVVIMGGVKASDNDVLMRDGFMEPDDAANNAFDLASALYFYRKLQELGIPTTVLMRHAAYACQVPFSIYDRLEGTGNAIGKVLRSRQAPSLNHLWQAANAPEGAYVRGKLPISRDRKWFITTFCDGKDPGISGDGDIWPYVGAFNLYDPMALVAAVPSLRGSYYEPVEVEVRGIVHRVIGLTKDKHGVKDAGALRTFIGDQEVEALEEGNRVCREALDHFLLDQAIAWEGSLPGPETPPHLANFLAKS